MGIRNANAAGRRAVGLLITVCLALGWAPSNSAAAPAGPRVALSGCYLGIVELLDDNDRLAAFVAEPFMVAEFYGPGTGAVSLWHFSCEMAAVDGQHARPAQLVLASVQIDPPAGSGWPTYVVRPEEPPATALYYLNTFDFYLHAAYSDHPQLVNALRRAGLPVELVHDLAFDRQARLPDPTGMLADPSQLHETATSVPSRRGRFGFAVQANKQHPPHEHDNSWWFSSPQLGEVRLRLEIPDAIDKWCSYGSPDCAKVSAEGDAAALLGTCDLESPRRDGLGIDHDRIEAGLITVSSGGSHASGASHAASHGQR